MNSATWLLQTRQMKSNGGEHCTGTFAVTAHPNPEMDELSILPLGSISGILVRIPTFSGSHTSSNWFSIPRSLLFLSSTKTRSERSSLFSRYDVADTLSQGGSRPNVIPTSLYFSFSRDTDGLVHVVGLQKRSLPRNCALCSHAVLQRLVVQHRNPSSLAVLVSLRVELIRSYFPTAEMNPWSFLIRLRIGDSPKMYVRRPSRTVLIHLDFAT